MSEGGSKGGASSHLQSEMAGKKSSVPLSLNDAFGRNADSLTALMHGHDVTLAQTMAEIIESLKNHASNNSGGGDGGGGSNVSYADLGSHSGPILNTGASQQSMADLAGGRNKSRDDSGGGMGM